MNLLILGSGGCTLIPRPGCTCPVCEEARRKGIPYTRTGPSLFLEDINTLFDTPEEISYQLIREKIHTLDYIFYTHWHPDHTMGMRVVEQMYMDFLAVYLEGKQPLKKVKICALPEVLGDIKAIQNKFGSFLHYYESTGLATLITLDREKPFKIKDFEIIPIPAGHPASVSTVFIIKAKDKKAVYAPCDTKPFPIHDQIRNADLLLIGDVLPDKTLKNGHIFPENNPLEQEVFTMGELINIITTLEIEKTIVTHIEEEWGKSFGDCKKIEKKYEEYNIEFAFDGMKIIL